MQYGIINHEDGRVSVSKINTDKDESKIPGPVEQVEEGHENYPAYLNYITIKNQVDAEYEARMASHNSVFDQIVDDIPAEVQAKLNLEIKANKWQETKDLREIKKQENIQYRDWIFQGNKESLENMERKLKRMNNGHILEWRDVDNVGHPFSDGDLDSMINIIIDRGELLYYASWEVEKVINESNNPESLDIDQIYSEKIEELKLLKEGGQSE